MNTDKHRFPGGIQSFSAISPLLLFSNRIRLKNPFLICVYPCLSVAFPFSSFSAANGYVFATVIPRHYSLLRNVAKFFAGFCLFANGTYIAIGSFEGVGDCREMLRSGTPVWAMIAFGAVAIPAELYQWHRLGTLRNFFYDHSTISQTVAFTVFGILVVIALAGYAFLPR